MKAEEWRQVPGYEGRYEVSSLGRVRSLPNSRRKTVLICKLSPHKSGHLLVNLTRCVGGIHKQKVHWVHRLVLEAFVGPCPVGLECCHGDGNPANNKLENLRWDSHVKNMQDKYSHGTHNIGEQNPMRKLTVEQVKEVKGLIERGESDESIAAKFDVTKFAIKSIRRGSNWRNV